MTKTYDNLSSSAIYSITIEDNVVKVVYNSNIDKEYTFNCQNTEQFIEELSKELIDVELDNNQGSVGKFINQQIKNQVLVQSK